MTAGVDDLPGECALDDATVAAFDADGVVVLRGLFADWVERLREGTAKLMASPSPRERSYQPKDGSGFFFQDLCNWQDIPEYRAFVLEGPGGRAAASLMKSQTGRFFHDHILVKEPGSSIVTPWHQDMPYYCCGGDQSVSFWIPLDPVKKAACLEVVAGSHKWGLEHRPYRFDGSPLFEHDSRPAIPDIEADRAAYRIVSDDLEPGDAIAFSFRAVHGAAANTSLTRRRVFSARFVGDDAIFIDRGGKGSPALPHLTLKTGERLDGPDFPVVFRQPRG